MGRKKLAFPLSDLLCHVERLMFLALLSFAPGSVPNSCRSRCAIDPGPEGVLELLKVGPMEGWHPEAKSRPGVEATKEQGQRSVLSGGWAPITCAGPGLCAERQWEGYGPALVDTIKPRGVHDVGDCLTPSVACRVLAG